MRHVGEFYTLRESRDEIEAGLTPSFAEVIRSTLGEPVPTKYGNPGYVFSITRLTDPLENFIGCIARSLRKRGATVFPLIRGFGFGKTHSLILLWHLLTAPEAEFKDSSQEMSRLLRRVKCAGQDVEGLSTIRSTVVPLPVDFSVLDEPPLTLAVRVVEALSKPTDFSSWKSRVLIESISEALEDVRRERLLTDSDEFLRLVKEFVENCRSRGEEPSILLLVDELGLGTFRRAEDYVRGEGKRASDRKRLEEVRELISFLTKAAEELQKKGVSITVVYAFADQDLESLKALQKMSREGVREVLDGLMDFIDSELVSRLGRYSGGLDVSPLSYNPQHMIDIALSRVLKKVGDVESASRELAAKATSLLRSMGLAGPDEVSISKDIERSYPLSPPLAKLISKLSSTADVPKSEFVRTAIALVARASERALRSRGAPTIGVEHLSMGEAALVPLMGELQADWSLVVADIAKSVGEEETDKDLIRDLAVRLAKHVLAKGATANALELVGVKDPTVLRRYGLTLTELQQNIALSFLDKPTDEVANIVERVPAALDLLKNTSFRVMEVDANGEKYYMPVLLKSILEKLFVYVNTEKEELKDVKPSLYVYNSPLKQLFDNLALIDATVVVVSEYSKLTNPEELMADERVRTAIRVGAPVIVVAPPWSQDLIKEMYEKSMSYEAILTRTADRLNSGVARGIIESPTFLVILVPNLEPVVLDELLEALVEYNAVVKFRRYFEDRGRVLEEYMKAVERTKVSRRLEDFFRTEKTRFRTMVEQQVKTALYDVDMRLVRLSRDLVSLTLKLYQAPLYYDIGAAPSFRYSPLISEEAERKIREELSGVSEGDLGSYYVNMNSFLRLLLERIGFESNVDVLAEALSQRLFESLKVHIPESIPVDDEVQSLVMGVYGVRPLSMNKAREAVLKLNGKSFRYEDKRMIVTVKIDAEAGKLLFRAEPIIVAPPPPPPPPPTPVNLYRFYVISYGDETFEKLIGFIDRYGSSIEEFSISFSSKELEGEVKLRVFDATLAKGLANYFLTLLRRFGAKPTARLDFSGQGIVKRVVDNWFSGAGYGG